MSVDDTPRLKFRIKVMVAAFYEAVFRAENVIDMGERQAPSLKIWRDFR